MEDKFGRFIYYISEVYRYWHRISADVMARYGMRGPYAVYFTTLYNSEKGLNATELREKCGRDKSDVSRAIAMMSERGFVTKVETGKTHYKANMLLTKEGRKVAEEIHKKAQTAVACVGEGLTDTQRQAFFEAMDTIVNNMQTLSREGFQQ